MTGEKDGEEIVTAHSAGHRDDLDARIALAVGLKDVSSADGERN